MNPRFFDGGVVAAAGRSVERLIEALLTGPEHSAVVGKAPAGAGKSYAIATAVQRCRKEGLRVAIATPLNEQAFALVSGIADRLPEQTITFVPARDVGLPEAHLRRNTVEREAKQSIGASIIVGTLSKLGDAFERKHLSPFDVLLIDEAYQANAVHYYKVGDLAPRHLLMGDSGQLAPFSSAPQADRWRGLREDPLLRAVDVLEMNHPNSHVERLPVTRRLDSRGAVIARAFYPGHPFEAAVLPGVRALSLSAALSSHASLDATLGMAAREGWAHLELPAAAVLAGDPQTVEAIVALLRRLFERGCTVRCENEPEPRPLVPAQVAVAVSHNDQKNLLRVALASAGLGDVVVNTANKLQGLTFEVVVAWHPLAGLFEVDEFHLDPGRLCVMLTRHRQACIVVGRAADRTLVEGIPPATESYLGWDGNALLDGWYVHEAVFSALAPFRIAA